jgi:hypothetical protein
LTEAGASIRRSTETGYAVGECVLQGFTVVSEAGVLRVSFETGENTDSVIRDRELKQAGTRPECDNPGVRSLRMFEHVIVDLAERADQRAAVLLGNPAESAPL